MLAAMSDRDTEFMRLALEEARQAERAGEVPIGAVIVAGDKVLARGWNRTITDCDPTAHAEIIALREAERALGHCRPGGGRRAPRSSTLSAPPAARPATPRTVLNSSRTICVWHGRRIE